MKLFLGLLIILMSIIISGVAAYFSVFGLMALFAAAALPVAIMGTVLEGGKLLMASVLHANWHNKNFTWPLKTFLGLCIALLMIINALGVYGYLSRGHLEQEAPRAGIEIQLSQLENQKNSIIQENSRINEKINLLDKSIETYLKNDKASQGEAARLKQKNERSELDKQLKENAIKLNNIENEMVPLKTKNAEVEAKLGPIKYVANLFGNTNPETAVSIVIILIMIAFDPFAVAMVIAGSILLKEHFQKSEKKIDKKLIKDFEEKINFLENEVDKQKLEIENIQNNKLDLENKIVNYEDEILSNQKLLEDYKIQLENNSNQLLNTNELQEQHNNEKELLTRSLEHASEERNRLRKNINELNEKIILLTNEKNNLENIIKDNNKLITKLEGQVSRMNSVTLLQELQSMDIGARKDQIIQILENNPSVVEEIVSIAKEIYQMTPGGDRIVKGKN